jgi:hypothetical protein
MPVIPVDKVVDRVARRHIFKPKNPNLGKFWRVLQWKMLVYFNGHLVYFRAIWYILWTFGIFSRFVQRKSGNPGSRREKNNWKNKLRRRRRGTR